MKSCFSLSMVFGFLVAANAADDAAIKKELDALDGSWQCVSMEIDGKAAPKELIKSLKLTFKDNKASHLNPDGDAEEASIKLDPSKKPKAIDMTPLTGPDKGKALYGIYSIEEDTLKICGAQPGSVRPAEFKAEKNVNLMVFKREKK